MHKLAPNKIAKYFSVAGRTALFITVSALSSLHFAAAQDTPINSSPSNPEGSDNLEDSLFICEPGETSATSGVTCKPSSNPVEMFRGWSQLYKGYDRSPIMFDSMRNGKSRVYPQLAYNGDGDDKEFKSEDKDAERKSSLRVLNLGVDDEVNKASMAIYQPLYFHTADFAADQAERDRHLNLFQSVRGIAIMTLSYLDKTVAAGLATTQSQADAHTTNQLLKQLNWSSAKIANPQRMPLYNDVDEKVEACMAHLGSTYAFTKRINMTNPICKPCVLGKDEYIPSRPMDGDGGTGGGAYDFCVCCAEKMQQATNSTVREGTEIAGPGTLQYSLVARTFLGMRGPDAALDAKVSTLTTTIQNFRRMYGDIVMAPCLTQNYNAAASEAKDTETCEASKIEYKFPAYSVADKILLFRNGLNKGCASQSDDGTGCPLTGTPINDGICPAIKHILTRWPPVDADKAVLKRLWIQASMGRLITGDDINNMFIMMGREPGDLRDGGGVSGARTWDDQNKTIVPAVWNNVNSRFKRFLSVYCDAAAISAFKKFHLRMQSILEDHLRLNQKATDYEKAKIKDLVSRVSNQIELAERDLESSSVADKMLAGLDSESDRERVSQMGAAAEAQDAAFWNEQMKNKITLWNWYRSK